ncbi:hypothetical protein ABPG72_014292 [Tetrahymena utriculariae]
MSQQRMEQTLPPNFQYNSNLNPQQSLANRSNLDNSGRQKQKIFQDKVNYRSTYQPQPINSAVQNRQSYTPNRSFIQDKQHWDNQFQPKDIQAMQNQEIIKPNLQERSKSQTNINIINQQQSMQNVSNQIVDINLDSSQQLYQQRQQQLLYQQPQAQMQNQQIYQQDEYEEKVKKTSANPRASQIPQNSNYILSDGIDQAQIQIAQVPNLTGYQKEQFKDMEIYFFHYNNQQAETSYDDYVGKLVKESEGVSACNIF